jgi:hypothetical protein
LGLGNALAEGGLAGKSQKKSGCKCVAGTSAIYDGVDSCDIEFRRCAVVAVNLHWSWAIFYHHGCSAKMLVLRHAERCCFTASAKQYIGLQ